MPVINGNMPPNDWAYGFVYDPIVSVDTAHRYRVRWPGWLDGATGARIRAEHHRLIEMGGLRIERLLGRRIRAGGDLREEQMWVISSTEVSRMLGMEYAFVSWAEFMPELQSLSRGYNDGSPPLRDWLPTEWPALTLDGPRPSRLISTEQEIAHGRSIVQTQLRSSGLLLDSSHHASMPYDPNGDGSQLAICYGMSDSSCDGEIVYTKLDLGNNNHAKRFGEASAIVQAMAARRETSVSFTCGYHVHVSGTDREGRVLTPNAIRRLYAIIGHVEPVLFRLAEGGVGRYRGGSHSKPIPKLPNGQPRTAMAIRNHWHDDRYLSVNISPFLDAIQRCNCGAMTWNGWQGCTCGQVNQGGTIEFRVWNGVTRPDTIHAFLALSDGIVDLSVRGRRMFDLPETPIMPASMRGGTLSRQESEAYKWLLDQLRLSDTEHAQIQALAARTSLAEAVTDTPSLPDEWQQYIATLGDQTEYMRS